MIGKIKRSSKFPLESRRRGRAKGKGGPPRHRLPKLERKVNIIARLAQKSYESEAVNIRDPKTGKVIRKEYPKSTFVYGHNIGREKFLTALGVRKSIHAPFLRAFPEFEERKRVYLSRSDAREEIKRDTELINGWLESEGKPKLKITEDELVRIIIE